MPKGFILGAGISIITWSILIAMFVIWKKKNNISVSESRINCVESKKAI